MEYISCINGLDVTARYTDESVTEIFLPLLRRLTALQREKERRILVMLAAPPAAGKSTLVSFLEHLSRTEAGLTPVQSIGMDGFHHYQDYLNSHTVVKNGKEISMARVKGSPISFDLPLMTERIRRIAAGESCTWPIYNRKLHNPQDNAIEITGDIILLEGNYLLLDRPGWADLRKYADYTVRISAEKNDVRERLIRRKAASTGWSREQTEQFVDYSDLDNVIEVTDHSFPADLNLIMLPDGSCQKA